MIEVNDLHDEDQNNFTDDVILGLGKTIQKKTQYAEAKSAVSELTDRKNKKNLLNWTISDGNTTTSNASQKDTVDGFRTALSGDIGDAIAKNVEASAAFERIRERTITQVYQDLEVLLGEKLEDEHGNYRVEKRDHLHGMIQCSTNIVIGQLVNQMSNIVNNEYPTFKCALRHIMQKFFNLYLTSQILLDKILVHNQKLSENDRMSVFELVKSFMSAIKNNFIEHFIRTKLYRDCLCMLERHGSFGTVIKLVFGAIVVYQFYSWWTKPSKVSLNI